MKLPLRFIASAAAAVALWAAPVAAQEAEDHSAALAVLTTDFRNLEEIFAKFNDPVHKLPVAGYIYLLKQRAVLLGWQPPEGMLIGGSGGRGGGGGNYGRGGRSQAKIEFDQVKYDELRYDINLWYQRIAIYLAPLRTPEPPPAGDLTARFDVCAIVPNPSNTAEVKAALDILDHEIRRMESATAKMSSDTFGRTEELAKLQRVKLRRAELGKQFTSARWDELRAEFGAIE